MGEVKRMTVKELLFHTVGGVHYRIEDYDTMRIIEEGTVNDYIEDFENKINREVGTVDIDNDNTLVVIV